MVFAVQNLATVSVNRNTDDPTISLVIGSGATIAILTIYLDDDGEGIVDSVSDDDGDTWVEAINHEVGAQRCSIWYVLNPTVGTKVITANTSASCDTVLNAASFTGVVNSTVVGTTGTGSSTSSAAVSVTFTPTLSDSLIIFVAGQNTNAAAGSSTLGSGQTLIDDGANGGAEKFYSIASQEIISAGGSNDQTVTTSKSADDNIACAAEIQLDQVAPPSGEPGEYAFIID